MNEPIQKPGKSRQDFVDISRERFASRFDSTGGADSCWPWIRGLCAGYGIFYLGGGRASPFNEYAHRLSLYYAMGTWGRVALHSCDNRRCCNPAHLSWGTHRDNSQDALRKGRMYIGESNSNAVLTEEIVMRIRALCASGILQKQIAEEFGISRSRVSAVYRRKTWTHV